MYDKHKIHPEILTEQRYLLFFFFPHFLAPDHENRLIITIRITNTCGYLHVLVCVRVCVCVCECECMTNILNSVLYRPLYCVYCSDFPANEKIKRPTKAAAADSAADKNLRGRLETK